MEYQFRPIEQWPGQPAKPKHSPFRAKHSETLQLLESELKHLRAKDIIIQAYLSDSDIRLDGMLRANANPKRPGIILSFESKHGPLAYPCDTYKDWQSNLRAIALSLQALRTVDRYGVTKRAEQYQGWAKLTGPVDPEGFATVEEAAAFLVTVGGGDTNRILAEPAARNKAYHNACVATHPDYYPQHQATFRKVQVAREMLINYQRQRRFV